MTGYAHTPVFGICGYRGAGKTTLIVELVRRLRRRGLAVLVLKHDAHGLDIDRLNKDTQRCFAAGADVLARDPTQTLARLHAGDAGDLAALVAQARGHYDVILVEGHKHTPLPRKLWLRRSGRDRAPEACRPVVMELDRDVDRVAPAAAWIERSLEEIHRRTPTMTGILLGGQSRRMGLAKHLLLHRGRTWLAHAVAAAQAASAGVVLLGAGRVPTSCARLPRLADVPGVGGPLAGMHAAMRWQPEVRWFFVPCDTPLLNAAVLRWLAEQVRPGIWAVQPRLAAGAAVEPLPGWYDFRAASLLEHVRGPSGVAGSEHVLSPIVPPELVLAFRDCDSPAQVRRLQAGARRPGMSGARDAAKRNWR